MTGTTPTRSRPREAEGGDPGERHRDHGHGAEGHDLAHRQALEVVLLLQDVRHHGQDEATDHQRVQDVAQVGEDADGDAPGDAPVEAVHGEGTDEHRDHGQVEDEDVLGAVGGTGRVAGDERDDEGPEEGSECQADDIGKDQATEGVTADPGHGHGVVVDQWRNRL